VGVNRRTALTSAQSFSARAIHGQRVLVQIAATPAIGYWTLDGSDNVTAWVPIVQPLPYGWILWGLDQR
jgi:hypothetical protein